MRIKAVIDRFEDKKAILLAGDQSISINWPRELLPEAKQGDVLAIDIAVDVEATKQAQAEVDQLFEQIIQQNRENNN